MPNIARELKRSYPQELLGLVSAVAGKASEMGQGLYLVGGAVRDLLLGRANLDLDLVVEGDAARLAQELARNMGGEVLTHPRFGTARLRLGGLSLDLAMARSETYPKPGALPQVVPGTIQDDLFRRDFTINAMAASLDQPSFGELFDPFGGKNDLDQGLIRILHSKSFSDDPTRILRALRYEQRLGFRLEQNTRELLSRDLGLMGRVSRERLRHELELILREERPERVICRAAELGVLQVLHPSLQGDGWLAERFEQARIASGDQPPEAGLYLALIAWRLSDQENESLITGLRIDGRTAKTMRDALKIRQDVPGLGTPDLISSALCRLLDSRSPQAVLAAGLAAEDSLVRQRLELYLSTLRYVHPSLNGDDLKRMGVPPGKQLGQLLQVIREARLDQRVKTREEEQELVEIWLSSIRSRKL